MGKTFSAIKKVAFADDDSEVLAIFDEYGFNVKKDLKNIHVTEEEKERIREGILDALRDNRGVTVIHKSPNNIVTVIKMRAAGGNGRGESGGLRVYLICGILPDSAVIFHIYPKTGSKRKDNISQKEKNKICKLADDLDGSVKRRRS